MRNTVEVIPCTASSQWNGVLELCSQYDFYHTAGYHLLHQLNSGDDGILIVFQEGEHIAAFPLLKRSLAQLEGLNDILAGYCDATSVYGYGGPVTNHDWRDRAFVANFSRALENVLREFRIVSVFSRLHPLMENDAGLVVGEIAEVGQTVSIDLTIPEDKQFRNYRRDHRYNITRARRSGMLAYNDAAWAHYGDFLHLYDVTMCRVKASDEYLFRREYFDELRAALGSNLNLFVVKSGSSVLSAGLFTRVGDIIQFHLSGSASDQMELAPSKMLIDSVRLWGNAEHAKVFHLGGGVGCREDSLYKFKAGFSDRRHKFKVWKHVLIPDLYQLATEQRQTWLLSQGLKFRDNGFFPLYRSPLVDSAANENMHDAQKPTF